MTYEKVLTKKVAEQFIEDADSVRLEEFAMIQDVAVERLIQHQGPFLNLNGLTSLSDVAAKSLSNYQGPHLFLDGLTSLSNAAVEGLSQFQGVLSLDGPTSLSDTAAESLSQHQGVGLLLNSLTSLSDDAAESLSRHQGNLSLSGLTSLSNRAIQSLSRCRGRVYWGNLPEESNALYQMYRRETKVLVRHSFSTGDYDIDSLFITTFGDLDRCEGKGYNFTWGHAVERLNLLLENLQLCSTDQVLIAKLEELFGKTICGSHLVDNLLEYPDEHE